MPGSSANSPRVAIRPATGKLGILDYYRLKNVQADTEMRESIAGTGSGRIANAP